MPPQQLRRHETKTLDTDTLPVMSDVTEYNVCPVIGNNNAGENLLKSVSDDRAGKLLRRQKKT
jgi:hypothetical protein